MLPKGRVTLSVSQVSQHPKFGGHRNKYCGDITVLVGHIISQD